MERIVARYRAGAAVFLLGTVASGLWLRMVLVRSELLGAYRFGDAVHAHSHLAFFGWVSMALFALVLVGPSGSAAGAGKDRGVRARLLRWHPGLVASASVLAFLSFLSSGYSPPSIAISVFHVLLWAAFAFLAWPLLAHRAPLVRRFHRAALVYLLVAGAGTVAPALVMVRGVSDPWWSQFAIGLFLVPFVSGWMALGVMGSIYAALGQVSGAVSRAVLLLVAAGAFPSVLAYPAGAGPGVASAGLGRTGMVLLGSGMLLFGWDLLRRRPRTVSFLHLAGVCGATAGALQLLLGLGVASEVAHRHPVVIAFLHLVLLGFVSSALVACLQVRGAGRPTDELPSDPAGADREVRGLHPAPSGTDPWAALWGAGLGVMLAGILVPALGPTARLAIALGMDPPLLSGLAASGGAAVAVSAAAVLPRLVRHAPRSFRQPSGEPRSAAPDGAMETAA